MGNLITDKTNQELVDAGVFDSSEKKLNVATEKEINDKVEQSFQDFLQKRDINLDEKPNDREKKLIEKWFNEWLDNQVNGILDAKKIDEIKKVNGDIEQALKNLSFQIELTALESKIQDNRGKAATSVDIPTTSQIIEENESQNDVVKLNSQLKIEKILKDQVTPDKQQALISLINTTNFNKKSTIIECLNGGTIEDIRKIQYILIGKEYTSGKNKKGDALKQWGTDGILGKETYDALIAYIESNKITSEAPESIADDGDGGKAATLPGGKVSVDGSLGGGAGGAGPDNLGANPSAPGKVHKENQPTSTPEYQDESYQIKSLYEGKGGENITIAKGLSLTDVKVIPEVLQNDFKFESDNNGNIIYKLPNENWEGTVSIKIGDKMCTITMKSTEDKEAKNGPKDIYDEIAALKLQDRRDNEDFKKIPQYVQKLKARYQELTKEGLPTVDEDNITELNKLKGAMNKLLAAYNINEIEKSIAKIKDGTGGITTEKGNLNYYIIPDAIIYIEGKFLSKDEYLQGTNNIKKKKYIEKTLWKKGTVELPADGSDFWYNNSDENLKSIKFKTLILSDDELFGKNNISGDTEIQYDAYGYGSKLEKKEFDKNARAAVNRLTRGLDEDLSIVSPNYNMMPGERVNLGKVRQGLNTLVKLDEDSKDRQNNITITDVFNFIATKYSEKVSGGKKEWKGIIQSKYPSLNDIQAGNIAELGAMYTAYKKDQDTHKLGDYFNKVMGLLENYFVRGVGEGDDKVTKFVDMYKREEIGVDKDVIDPDKENKAIRLLFKQGKEESPLGIGFEKSTQLTALENIVKNNKFNLADFFRKWGIGVNPVDLNKQEKAFYAQYEQYLQKLNSGELDSNHKPNISESTYYNAVFDFLVGIGESRKDIVSSVNSLRLYDSDISNAEAQRCGFEYGDEMKLICMLTDTNFDGREDFADINGGFRTGLEIKSIYKDIKVDKEYGLIQKQPIQNLLDFATQYALHDSDVQYKLLKEISKNISEKVNEIDKNDNIPETEKVKAKDKAFYTELWKQLEGNKSTLLYLQKVLLKTPVEGGVGKIFKYGASAEVSSEKHELSASEKALKEIMDNQEFNATFEREYKKLVEQGLEDTPQVKAKFKPIVAAGVLANLEGTDPSFDVNAAVGGTWNTKAGDFTLLLGVGATIEGGFDPDSVGVAISRGKSWPVGKNTNIYTWAGAGATVGTKGENLTILAATGFNVNTLVNKNKLKNSLKSHPEYYFNTGISVGAGFSPQEDAQGVFAGVNLGYHKERLKGIKTQSENLKKELGGDNGVIMNILSQIDLGKGTSQQWKQVIRTELEKKYYNKGKKLNEEATRLLDQATDNIYGRLAYYMVGTNMDGMDEATKTSIKKDIANKLAEAYAVSFVNQEVANIEGKTELTGLGFSVTLYYIGVLVPIATVGFTISTYKGIYASETTESKARYKNELMTGAHAELQGNDLFYDDSDPDNVKPLYREKKDKDGNVVTDKEGNTEYECPLVNWINDKLKIANPNVKLPKITVEVKKASTSLSGVQPERVLLKLPKDLYKYVNINIKSKLQNNVQTDTNGDLLVPGNTMIRLLTSDKPNTGKFNLIIGGLQPDDNDLVLAANQQLYGAPTEYAGEVSTYQLDVDRFNNNLNEFIKSHEADAYSDFPIQKCEKLVNENGESKALLKLTPLLNMEDMGSSNSKTEIKDGYIYTPQIGTLTIYKDKEGKFHLYYQSNPKNDLKINYEIEGQDKEVSMQTAQESLGSYSVNFNEFKDIFDVAGVEQIFQGIERELSKVDDGKWKSYVDFMEKACDVASGNRLNQQDYDGAYAKLLEMLSATNLPKLNDLKNKLNSGNITDKEKVMVVDRFKTLFSYLPQLTDGKTDGKNIESAVNSRKTKYKELKGYDRTTSYPLTTDYRTNIVNKLKTENHVDRTPINNLFGMTAFYKIGYTGSDHKTKVNTQLDQAYGYSMTQMGHTNVLGGVNAMETIGKDELAKTREWFTNNLEKSDAHADILCDMLKKNINDLLNGSNIKVDGDIKLDKETLIKLLKGETDIVIGKSIDNGGENDIMLSGDLKYVFYLLGECANESIGVQLNGLTVKTKKTIITEQISTEPGEASSVTVVGRNTKRTGGPGVGFSSHEAMIQNNIARQQDASFFGGGGLKKGSPTTEGDTFETGTTEGDTFD